MLSLSRCLGRSLVLARSAGAATTLAAAARVPALSTPGLPLAAAAAALHTTPVTCRARKGTRMRKRKEAMANQRKRLLELKRNPPPLPRKIVLMLRSQGFYGKPKPIRADESDLTFATDNFFWNKMFCYTRYDFATALRLLRQHYDPSMLDRPDDMILARVELNMAGAKTDKYMEEFQKMVPILHPFDPNHVEKAVFAFVSTEEQAKQAMAAGAHSTGGPEAIQEIIKGRLEVNEIDHFVCHEDLTKEMKVLSGLLRDKTPRVVDGSIGSDLAKMIRTFVSGMEISVKKVRPSLTVADEPDLGVCEAQFGLLSQDAGQLEDNFRCLLETLNENKPRRKTGGFITRAELLLANGPESARFSVRHDLIYDQKLMQAEGRKVAEKEDAGADEGEGEGERDKAKQ